MLGARLVSGVLATVSVLATAIPVPGTYAIRHEVKQSTWELFEYDPIEQKWKSRISAFDARDLKPDRFAVLQHLAAPVVIAVDVNGTVFVKSRVDVSYHAVAEGAVSVTPWTTTEALVLSRTGHLFAVTAT